jgi:hypothetical protein
MIAKEIRWNYVRWIYVVQERNPYWAVLIATNEF